MSLRVLILSENKPTGFSGGRYHVLMLAMALAHQGHEVTYQTNYLPGFLPDFEGHQGLRHIQFEVAERFVPLSRHAFDAVILAPGRAFRSDLYLTARASAVHNKAEFILLNFESANWYNSVSPTKRDVAEWTHWKEALSIGGTVLSSAKESQKWARKFYPKQCRHAVWSPPIHAKAADIAPQAARERRIALVTRFDDAHKGADRIEAMLPEQARGYTLSLMTSSPVSNEMQATLADRLAIRGVELDLIRSPDEVRKFTELKRAKAVLFPSRFEGYGLPPIEALYCGAEVACFDLPVLRETCGTAPHFADGLSPAALAHALDRALEQPDRSDELRAAVQSRADFDAASLELSDTIERFASSVMTGASFSTGRLAVKAPAQSKLLRRVKALRTRQGRARVQGRFRRLLNRLPAPLVQVENVTRVENSIVLISGFVLGAVRPNRGEASIGGVKTSLEVGKARPDLLDSYPEYDEAYGGFSGEIRLPLEMTSGAVTIMLYNDGTLLHELEAVIPVWAS